MFLFRYCHRWHRSLSCFWMCQHLWFLHYRCLYFTRTCLHHRDWAASGLVWITGAGAAPFSAYTTETWSAHGLATHTQKPELHLDVSTLQRPLQLLDVFFSLRLRGLSCTWSCLETEACAAPWLIYTIEVSAELWDVSTLYRPAMLLVLSTPQYKGSSCTWTCLDSSSLCCFYWGVYTTGTWAPDGRACTIESCAAPGRVSSTGPGAAPGRVWTTGTGAAPGL